MAGTLGNRPGFARRGRGRSILLRILIFAFLRLLLLLVLLSPFLFLVAVRRRLELRAEHGWSEQEVRRRVVEVRRGEEVRVLAVAVVLAVDVGVDGGRGDEARLGGGGQEGVGGGGGGGGGVRRASRPHGEAAQKLKEKMIKHILKIVLYKKDKSTSFRTVIDQGDLIFRPRVGKGGEQKDIPAFLPR